MQGGHDPNAKTFWVPPWIQRCSDAHTWIATHDGSVATPVASSSATAGPDFIADERQRLDALRKRAETLSFLTGAADHGRIEAAVHKIYAAQGYDAPPVLWAEGPMQALVLFGVLGNVADREPWPMVGYPQLDTKEEPGFEKAICVNESVFWWTPKTLNRQMEIQLGGARRSALTGWCLNWDLSMDSVMLNLSDVIGKHTTGVRIGSAVRDAFLDLVAHHWPGALDMVKHWMPPAEEVLTCDDLHCPGEYSGWQGGLRPEWSLCDRAYHAIIDQRGIHTFWSDASEWHEAWAARELGAVFHPIHDELIDAWLVMGECTAAIFRPGIAICVERPMSVACVGRELAIEFADGVRLLVWDKGGERDAPPS
jgi:hypothetical protein